MLRVSVNKNIAVVCITGNTNTRNTKPSTAPPAVALNLTLSWKPLTSYQNWRGSSAGNPSPCSGYGISSRISCASPNSSHLTTARGSHFVIELICTWGMGRPFSYTNLLVLAACAGHFVIRNYLCLRHADAIFLYELTCACCMWEPFCYTNLLVLAACGGHFFVQAYMRLRIGRRVTLSVVKERQPIFCIFVTQFRCSYENKIVCASL